MSGIRFRTAAAADLALFADWAAAEGWNPGLDDAAPFHATDPGGFFLAEAQGAPVAVISVVNHNDSFAFLGFYICRPDCRGRGVGFGLWQHALAHAGGRTVGLDGVADQQANYAKSGFLRTGATTRYAGSLAPEAHPHIRPAAAGDLAAIAGLDREANGLDRSAFVRAWTRPTPTRATHVLEDNGRIAGFATARDCREGVKLGPIVAPDPARALTLAQASLAGRAQGPVFIDLPQVSTGFAARLTDLGFVPTFATARMYRGPAPAAGPSLQAIATMELG